MKNYILAWYYRDGDEPVLALVASEDEIVEEVSNWVEDGPSDFSTVQDIIEAYESGSVLFTNDVTFRICAMDGDDLIIV